MHRRKRLRKSLMPSVATTMDVDGESGTVKPLKVATQEHKATNIQQLTDQLERITITKIAKDAQKKRSPSIPIPPRY